MIKIRIDHINIARLLFLKEKIILARLIHEVFAVVLAYINYTPVIEDYPVRVAGVVPDYYLCYMKQINEPSAVNSNQHNYLLSHLIRRFNQHHPAPDPLRPELARNLKSYLKVAKAAALLNKPGFFFGQLILINSAGIVAYTL